MFDPHQLHQPEGTTMNTTRTRVAKTGLAALALTMSFGLAPRGGGDR
jgi:hypothetical protein